MEDKHTQDDDDQMTIKSMNDQVDGQEYPS